MHFTYDLMNMISTATAQHRQFGMAYLRWIDLNDWHSVRLCKRFQHLAVLITHNSCDENNCASVKLEAKWELKARSHPFCHQLIEYSPKFSCFKSPECHSDPHPWPERTTEPQQIALAALIETAIRIPDCCPYFHKIIARGSWHTCDIPGCELAKESAMNISKRLISNEACHQFIKARPTDCVQYDCT